jgi:hypothetical protein
MFYLTFLLSSVKLSPIYIEVAYHPANLSILEILGYSVVSLKYWDTLFGGTVKGCF